jgi:hypothetical protein
MKRLPNTVFGGYIIPINHTVVGIKMEVRYEIFLG